MTCLREKFLISKLLHILPNNKVPTVITYQTRVKDWMRKVAKFLVPDWGDKANSGQGVVVTGRQATKAGCRYDNPMPESTISSTQGL
jgi:hypothetical protein